MDKVWHKYILRHSDVIRDIRPINGCFKSVVVIPAYLEKEWLIDTLKSLTDADIPTEKTLVLVIVNAPESADEEIINKQEDLYLQIMLYAQEHNSDNLVFDAIKVLNMPHKDAGVGLARKIGMDLAIKHFYRCTYNGIIISLDADCLVEANYFTSLEAYFKNDKNRACNIYFEHVSKNDLSTEPIQLYELHLRLYVYTMKYIGLPYAYHTVGSCFAMSGSEYVKAGGMPRKQAGEDFYLLQKVIAMGGFDVINSTTVYPSARESDRVPFGTGPSVSKILADDQYLTYNPQAFIDLEVLIQNRSELYYLGDGSFEPFLLKLSGRLRSFLVNSDFEDKVRQLNKNCSSELVFNKRFFEVFPAFYLVKYLNYVHQHFLEKIPVEEAAQFWLEHTEKPEKTSDFPDAGELLTVYRKMERE